MTILKKDNTTSWTSLLFLGLLLAYSGAYQLLTERPGIRWGVEIPLWTSWVELPAGLVIVFLSIRALISNLRKAEYVKVYRWGVLAGVVFIFSIVLRFFIDMDHSYWGFPVFALTSAFLPLGGLCIIALSIRPAEAGESGAKPQPPYAGEIDAEPGGTPEKDFK